MHHPALGERPPRQTEAAARVEREIEVEADRQVALGCRLPRERQGERFMTHDVSETRPPTILQPVVGKHALPIAFFRRGPVSGQLGTTKARRGLHLEFARAADAYVADMPAADQAEPLLTRRRR